MFVYNWIFDYCTALNDISLSWFIVYSIILYVSWEYFSDKSTKEANQVIEKQMSGVGEYDNNSSSSCNVSCSPQNIVTLWSWSCISCCIIHIIIYFTNVDAAAVHVVIATTTTCGLCKGRLDVIEKLQDDLSAQKRVIEILENRVVELKNSQLYIANAQYKTQISSLLQDKSVLEKTIANLELQVEQSQASNA